MPDPSFRNSLFIPEKDAQTVVRELSFGVGLKSEKQIEQITSPVYQKKCDLSSMMDNSVMSQKATDHNTSFVPASCFSKVSDEVIKNRALHTNLKENSTVYNQGSLGVFTPMSGLSLHKNKISDTYSEDDPLMPRNQDQNESSSSFHTHSSFYESVSSDREWYQNYKKQKQQKQAHIDLEHTHKHLISPKSFNYHLGDSNTPMSGGQKSGSDLLFTP